MGNRKGHNEAQSMDEMLSSMNEAKEKGLNVRQGHSIYKKESGDYQEDMCLHDNCSVRGGTSIMFRIFYPLLE